MRRYPFVAAAALLVLALEGQAQPRVAIVAAAGTAQGNDAQAKLMGTGLFAEVANISVTSPAPLPTMETLMQYDAVITWSNQTYTTPETLGDMLADYVDAGRGVVVAVFATSTTTANRSLGGRFRSGGYEIIPTQSGNTGGAATLGSILVPTHPTVQGVVLLNGGTTASRPTTTDVSSHGYKVALWSDGKTLIAASTRYPNRIDLGMYPPSRDAVSTSWDPESDGARILANALLATIPATPPCDPDLNQDGNVDQDDVAYLVNVVGGGENPTGIDPDFNRDGNADQDDIAALVNTVGGGGCP
jgi:hypothetical protein